MKLTIELNTEQFQELEKYKAALQRISNYKQHLPLPILHKDFKAFALFEAEKALGKKEA
jgi:hypothetical protein